MSETNNLLVSKPPKAPKAPKGPRPPAKIKTPAEKAKATMAKKRREIHSWPLSLKRVQKKVFKGSSISKQAMYYMNDITEEIIARLIKKSFNSTKNERMSTLKARHVAMASALLLTGDTYKDALSTSRKAISTFNKSTRADKLAKA